MDRKIKEALRELSIDNNCLYYAAIPGYKHNFSRDSFLYGLLAGDAAALLAQIDYSSKHQGVEANAETGEEKGKIHHQYPSGEWRGRPTLYNACDTTALYLIAIAILVRRGHSDLLDKYKSSINSAIGYITSHLIDNIFYEDPALCGADDFAVRVTYWKDSVLNSDNEEPKYPIVYSLVHFQNTVAFALIGEVLKDRPLVEHAEAMTKKGLDNLWDNDHFAVGIDDQIGIIDAPSSDSLHSLLYIPPRAIPADYAKSVQKYSEQLETKCGYRSGIAKPAIEDVYHTRYMWVFEQALLNAAARSHNLREAASITQRVSDCTESGFPELLDMENDFEPAGNNLQLWSVGAAIYFKDCKKSYFPLFE